MRLRKCRTVFILLLLLFVAGCSRVTVETDDGTGVCPEGAVHQGVYLDDVPIAIPPSGVPGWREEAQKHMTSFFELLESFRTENGGKPFMYHNDLAFCADVRAKEVPVVFSHTRPNEEPFWLRLVTEDYPVSAEIFAKKGNSAEEAMKAFMDSAAHREILLNPAYQYVGIAVYKHEDVWYWVAMFGE